MNKLSQKKFMNGRRDFVLSNDNTQLKVTYSSMTNVNEETIDLYTLDEKYERIRYREFKWLVAAVPMYLLAIKFAIDAISFPDAFPIAIALIFLLPAVAVTLRYFAIQQDQTIFRYYQSGDVALLIWNNKPSQKAASEFVENIESIVKKMKLNPKLSNEQKLDIYSKHLTFLFDEGVLSEKEVGQIYKRIEKKLIKSESNIVSLVK